MYIYVYIVYDSIWSQLASPYLALECVAVCCSVLQYAAVCCSVLQCVAVRCSNCSVLQCVAVCFVISPYLTIQRDASQWERKNEWMNEQKNQRYKERINEWKIRLAFSTRMGKKKERNKERKIHCVSRLGWERKNKTKTKNPLHFVVSGGEKERKKESKHQDSRFNAPIIQCVCVVLSLWI